MRKIKKRKSTQREGGRERYIKAEREGAKEIEKNTYENNERGK